MSLAVVQRPYIGGAALPPSQAQVIAPPPSADAALQATTVGALAAEDVDEEVHDARVHVPGGGGGGHTHEEGEEEGEENETRSAAADRAAGEEHHHCLPVLIPHLAHSHGRHGHELWGEPTFCRHTYTIHTERATIVSSYGTQLQRPPAPNMVGPPTEVANRQRQQASDLGVILRDFGATGCGGSPVFMLVDDDVVPCIGFDSYFMWVRAIMDRSDVRVARTSMGTNGLLFRCADMAGLADEISRRLAYRGPDRVAIDSVIDRWAGGGQYVFRFNLLSHGEEHESTLWGAEEVRNRDSINPGCLDPLVWWGVSFDFGTCRTAMWTPCPADEPTASSQGGAALAHVGKDPHYRVLDRRIERAAGTIAARMGAVLAPVGSSCEAYCASQRQRCDATLLALLNHCAILTHLQPGCTHCTYSTGRELPMTYHDIASNTDICSVHVFPDRINCEGSWNEARRLCTCTTG